METRTQLHEVRQQRGVSAARLAQLTGVSRQTIYAIEAGDYVPNTTLALQLAKATVAGAGELARVSSEPPGRLRENVTSPGGTTRAALDVLMSENGLAELMTRAVAAATKRSRELAS